MDEEPPVVTCPADVSDLTASCEFGIDVLACAPIAGDCDEGGACVDEDVPDCDELVPAPATN